MGSFINWMDSVDLPIEQASGDNSADDWLRIDEQLHREFNARARNPASMVQGRVVYEVMEEFWPRAREDASLPDLLGEWRVGGAALATQLLGHGSSTSCCSSPIPRTSAAAPGSTMTTYRSTWTTRAASSPTCLPGRRRSLWPDRSSVSRQLHPPRRLELVRDRSGWGERVPRRHGGRLGRDPVRPDEQTPWLDNLRTPQRGTRQGRNTPVTTSLRTRHEPHIQSSQPSTLALVRRGSRYRTTLPPKRFSSRPTS